MIVHVYISLILWLHTVDFHLQVSPDHWSYYVNYLNCQIKCHSAGEGTKAGHSHIIEAKDFIKSVEEAKKSGRFQAPFLAELELIWKAWKLQEN